MVHHMIVLGQLILRPTQNQVKLINFPTPIDTFIFFPNTIDTFHSKSMSFLWALPARQPQGGSSRHRNRIRYSLQHLQG